MKLRVELNFGCNGVNGIKGKFLKEEEIKEIGEKFLKELKDKGYILEFSEIIKKEVEELSEKVKEKVEELKSEIKALKIKSKEASKDDVKKLKAEAKEIGLQIKALLEG